MQYVESRNPLVRALATWSGALAGLMLILVGGMIPSATILPDFDLPPKIMSLPSTWQTPALLICSLVCGPKAGIIASVAYLTIGLFYLPFFHGGGTFNYHLIPSFGYLAGFIPAAWISGCLANRTKKNGLVPITSSALGGLLMIHMCGILNLSIGALMGRWQEPLLELIFSYSLAPLPAQMALCPAVGIISIGMRRLLLIE